MDAHTSEQVANQSGRDLRGMFAAGNRLSKGNPSNRRMAELRRAIHDAVTEADVKDVIKSLGDSAKAGDVIAAKVFLEFVVGKPTQPIEVSGPDDGSVNVDAFMARIMVGLSAFPEARRHLARVVLGGEPQTIAIGAEIVQPATDQST
jgi:hypothetical protein